MTSPITPVILTYNEAPNIRRTLQAVAWAEDVVVMDSCSTDETLDILREFPNVRLVQRKFDDHTAQWNAGVAAATTDWILALDADYVLTPELVEELKRWQPAAGETASYCRFRYCIEGQPLRGTLYPPRAVLFDRSRCTYVQDGHTQTLKITGDTGWLQHPVDHDDRKPISRWLWAQDRYAALEVEKLLSASNRTLRFQDRIRRQIILAPGLVFFYTLIGKGLILDGWPGWFYVFQRTLAELILSLRLAEAKIKGFRKNIP